MLRGHATAKVDEKGRLKIPAEFLEKFLALCGESRLTYLTSMDGKVALLYPLPVWEEQERKLSRLSSLDEHVGNFSDAVSYWGHEQPVDSQGRILIPSRLRETARIDGTVSVIGQQRRLAIRDHEELRTNPPVVTKEDLAWLAAQGL